MTIGLDSLQHDSLREDLAEDCSSRGYGCLLRKGHDSGLKQTEQIGGLPSDLSAAVKLSAASP